MWNKYGKAAGFKRNKNIIDNCTEIIAFWDGKSKGTLNSINYAKSINKKVTICYFDGTIEIYQSKLEEFNLF